VRDVLSVLGRRFPLLEVDLLPTLVQGSSAAQITRLLQAADASGRYDVILLTRGGGSLEDLWAFNDEALARAIAASHTPVVSAVGHETDFSLSDFAADLRAPTPSVAAELLVPTSANWPCACAARPRAWCSCNGMRCSRRCSVPTAPCCA
jgi:exodeoxyribonuclease VII large subunit